MLYCMHFPTLVMKNVIFSLLLPFRLTGTNYIRHPRIRRAYIRNLNLIFILSRCSFLQFVLWVDGQLNLCISFSVKARQYSSA